MPTKRQFSVFVSKLNTVAARFGIRFGSWEIGREVNFLDVTLYFDVNNKIHYCIYTKPTDARNYLRTDSFHALHTFKSVAFSQMLRVANRNSKDDTRKEDLEQLIIDLKRSGHSGEVLKKLEPIVLQRVVAPEESVTENTQSESPETVVFTVQHFQELPELKKLLRETEEELHPLTGPLKITVATKNGVSIGNWVIRNSAIGKVKDDNQGSEGRSQKCGAGGCKTCTHMSRGGDKMVINGLELTIPPRFSCKRPETVFMLRHVNCVGIQGRKR